MSAPRQWFQNGDHPNDECVMLEDSAGNPFLSEGKVVRYFRHPFVSGQRMCEQCGCAMHVHGWIDSGGDGRTVCPGDFILHGPDGYYPSKTI